MNDRIRSLFVCWMVSLVMVASSGCTGTSASRCPDSLETGILEMAKRKNPDELILEDFDPAVRENVAYRFGNTTEQLEQIDLSLNSGYAKLADDIERGRYSCIDKKELSQYKGSEWTYRSIGFPNWVKSIQGHLLLEKARSIKYEIMLLQQVKCEEAAPLLKERKELLRTLIEKVTSLTRDEEWRE